MPKLVFTGISEDALKSISKALVDELTDIVQCPRDYFTLELKNSIYIFDGETVPVPVMVEVNWFDRGKEIQDNVAKTITTYMKKSGCTNIDVVFTFLSRRDYYENGEHF